MSKTTVLTARVPETVERTVRLLAQVRGVDRQVIVKDGVELMLATITPEELAKMHAITSAVMKSQETPA